MEYEYFECQCSYFDHLVRFTLDEKNGDVWVETRMSHFLPWWARVLVAVNYVLGRGSKMGQFSETQLRPEDFVRLHEFMDRASLAKRVALNASQQPTEKPVLKG